MPGILNKTLYTTEFGVKSTSQLRDILLGRNLPPPINQTLIEGGLVPYLADIRKVINTPIYGPGDENITIHYDEDKRAVALGEFYRNTQNVNKNKFAPLNDEYIPFTLKIPESLGIPIPEWAGDGNVIRNPYPFSYRPDEFNLINKGSNKGVLFPFEVIQNYKNLNLQKESSLGLIGGEELEKAIINKIAQVEEESNPDVPNTGYITPPIGGRDGAVNSYINRLKGSEQYYNTLPNAAVGWQEYSTNPKTNKIQETLAKVSSELGGAANPSLSTEQRVNSLLERTSETQVNFLFNLMGKNLYVPEYTDRRLAGTEDEGTNSRYYIGSERSTNLGGGFPTIFNNEEFNGASGSDPLEFNLKTTVDENFFWTTGDQSNFNEKTLLAKTQKLVDEHPNGVWINQTKKYFKDEAEDRLISRGSAISKLSFIEAAANGAFCRVWTVNDQYNYLKAIRNTGLFSSPDPSIPGFSVSEGKSSLSVLNNNGIVKTHPTKEDSITTFKKFMFSLENLAWSDNLADLPLNEIGGGDLLTGNKGRIMWFPPYNLSFDENISANWTKTDFIGRGEPVFTYNNSSRSGQISFQIVVDHPKVINGYRGKRTDAIERFFSGCISPTTFLEFLDKNEGASQMTKKEVEKKLNSIALQKASNTQKIDIQFSVYFSYDDDETFYVSTFNGPPLTAPDSGFPPSDIEKSKDLIGELISTDNKVVVKIEGYAGPDETDPKPLSKGRAETVRSALELELGIDKKSAKIKVKSFGDKRSSTTQNDGNNFRVDITIENDSVGGPQVEHKPQENLGDLAYYPLESQIIDNLIINECNYFEFLDANYPTYFQTISEKIKYFHAGFHSTTPEGLNTRLTFLQQCMRQGPSVYDDNGSIQPQNLAFGRPPICILRIGDFFYTKVAINSLNITYAQGNTPQWDLNPEGIGVQPMIANITMGIDIIGGQSLIGPINRLQNALSFNYYANTEMYDVRADSIDKSTGTIVPGLKLGEIKSKAGVDIDKLGESLKKEGITNQGKDASNSGDNTQTDVKSGIDVLPDGDNASRIKITSTLPPGEVNIGGEIATDNLLAIKIKVERKGIGYKETFNEEISEDEISIQMDVWNEGDIIDASIGSEGIDGGNLKKIEGEIDELLTEIQFLEDTLSLSATTIPIPATDDSGDSWGFTQILNQINSLEKDVKDKEKEIKKMENGSNKVKVEAYYTKDKRGSRFQREFTYGSAGLTY